jgi:holo-[acyl-carrier protein] synthase
MVLGLGVDLIEMERVARALDRWDGRLVDKLMGPEEAARLPPPGPDRVLAIARAIAAKEAASKAIGTGWTRGVRWRDVVLEGGSGPSVRLDARAGETARRLGSSGRTRTTLEVRGGLVLGEVRLLT